MQRRSSALSQDLESAIEEVFDDLEWSDKLHSVKKNATRTDQHSIINLPKRTWVIPAHNENSWDAENVKMNWDMDFIPKCEPLFAENTTYFCSNNATMVGVTISRGSGTRTTGSTLSVSIVTD